MNGGWTHPAAGKEGVLEPGRVEHILERIISAPPGAFKVDSVCLDDVRPDDERALTAQRAILSAACRVARTMSGEKVKALGREALAIEGGALVSQAVDAARKAARHLKFALGDIGGDALKFIEVADALSVASEPLASQLAPPSKSVGRKRAEIADAVAAEVLRTYERVTGRPAPKNTSPDAPARRILEAVGSDLRLALGAENMRRAAMARPPNN